MHPIGVRKTLLALPPWLSASLFEACAGAKALAMADLDAGQALKIALPWLAAEVAETKQLMGEDWWPYGIAANRLALESLVRYAAEQGVTARRLEVAELFHTAAESL